MASGVWETRMAPTASGRARPSPLKQSAQSAEQDEMLPVSPHPRCPTSLTLGIVPHDWSGDLGVLQCFMQNPM